VGRSILAFPRRKHRFTPPLRPTKPSKRASPRSHGIRDRLITGRQKALRPTNLIGLCVASNRNRT
jgi:ribosomal protein L34